MYAWMLPSSAQRCSDLGAFGPAAAALACPLMWAGLVNYVAVFAPTPVQVASLLHFLLAITSSSTAGQLRYWSLWALLAGVWWVAVALRSAWSWDWIEVVSALMLVMSALLSHAAARAAFVATPVFIALRCFRLGLLQSSHLSPRRAAGTCRLVQSAAPCAHAPTWPLAGLFPLAPSRGQAAPASASQTPHAVHLWLLLLPASTASRWAWFLGC